MDFVYKAKSGSNPIVEGKITAPDESSAISTLHSKGYVVISLDQIEKDLFSIDIGRRIAYVSKKDIVVFTRQLATLIDADMPITESLRTLSKQIQSNKFKSIITGVSEAVEGGSALSAALSLYPDVFGPFYVRLVQSGEVSGKMHDSLLYLADYLERNQSITSKLRGALAYPAFILFALVLVGAIMSIYVLPQLLSIFQEAGVQDLPFTTRILIWTTNFINHNLAFIVLVFAGGVGIFGYFLTTSDGKSWLDELKINGPGLGRIIRNFYLARMAESLSTLLKSGISILDAMHITGDLVGNSLYRSILFEAEENIKSGGRLSETLVKYEEIPPLFASMVAVGEKTGKLDYILEHITKFYKEESENAIQTLSSILEPALVLVLGVAVAIMVSSILLPIYNLVGSA